MQVRLSRNFCEKIQNPFSKTVVVVCGKGNNGGDGVIALHNFKKYNVSSKIVFIEKITVIQIIKKYKISKSEYSIYNDKINLINMIGLLMQYLELAYQGILIII